jgi:hypothetical protein
MDAAIVSNLDSRGSDLLLEHCFGLEREGRCTPALARLEAKVGVELAHQLMFALVGTR